MEELLRGSARAMAAAVAAREVSPVELLDAHIARIEELNPRLNAIVLPDLERARGAADEAQRAIGEGRELGPLHGVPFTAKETVEVEGMPACGASRIFEGHVSTMTAPILERIRAAGGVFLGKTNIPEFAIGYDADNLVYGATGNPHEPGRSVGGSSGGEAAAISACLSAFGIGSDYGGSVRVPAHYCGCAALKPGRGGGGYTGFFPAPLPLSVRQWTTAGPMARRVATSSC